MCVFVLYVYKHVCLIQCICIYCVGAYIGTCIWVCVHIYGGVCGYLIENQIKI